MTYYVILYSREYVSDFKSNLPSLAFVMQLQFLIKCMVLAHLNIGCLTANSSSFYNYGSFYQYN